MNGRDLVRFVDKPRCLEFQVAGGFKAEALQANACFHWYSSFTGRLDANLA